MNTISIAVVGDGPIGNLVIAKLLIEHHKNKHDIKITHHTSNRFKEHGYTRRHILFITDKLVRNLEKNILECENCLYNVSNNQKLTEETHKDRIKLLFSTRVLEQTLLNHINETKDKYCNSPKCIFTNIVNNDKDDDYNYYNYDYVFFAIGNNSPNIRKKIFYDSDTNDLNTIKIIADETEPIVAFYLELGPILSTTTIFDNDKKSFITLVNKTKLSDNDIDIYDLDIFVNIIYTFHDKFEGFIKNLPKDETKKTILESEFVKKILYQSSNLSLEGYLNFTNYIYKFTLAINTMQFIFKNKIIFDLYINHIRGKIRTHQINAKSLDMYDKIINNNIYINDLLLNYSNLILKLLNNIIDKDTCFLNKSSKKCLDRTFLVNIVQQSLNSYGIINYNKLVYAAKKEKTNFFMIGDMSNAYTPGISLEIGINFVNYIIPMFYNFYIAKNKIELDCKRLNIITLLQELLDKSEYSDLFNKKINDGSINTDISLRSLIVSIKDNYENNLDTLCDNNDIFLTYYNIVLLIQYIKHADLILKNKQIIAISDEFNPDEYRIIDNEIERTF